MAVDVTAAVADVGCIGGGDDGVDAGNPFRFAGVNADYFGMGILAPQDGTVQLVLQHQVYAVDALPDDALDAAHARWAATDHFEFRFCHGLTPSCDSVGGELDRVDDLGVTRAAADIAGDCFLDLVCCRLGRPVQQCF